MKDGLRWWRLPNVNATTKGDWLAVKTLPNGMVEVRQVPAAACGC